jgi:hypothetical protein
MAYLAQYDGTCTKCDTPIVKHAHYITHSRRSEPNATKGYSHVDCENPTVNPKVTVSEAPTVIASAPTSAPALDADKVKALLDAITGVIPQPAAPAIDADKVREIVLDTIAEVEGELVRKIQVEVKQYDVPDIKIDNAHENLASLVQVLALGKHVLMVGPPASGKSTAAHQVAHALNRNFGYLSGTPQTPDSRLMGFIDAQGTFRSTEFRKAYQHGGVFCLDEVDNLSGSFQTALNSSMENGLAAFPDGMVEKHEHFVLCATANTVGYGANPLYPDRRPMDAAFRDRFVYIDWQYDESLERTITMAINNNAKPWLAWVRKVRTLAATKYPKLLVSPRAAYNGALLLKQTTIGVRTIAEMTLFKGFDASAVTSILSTHPIPEVAR